MSPGDRVIIGKGALRGTVIAVKSTLVDVLIDTHKKTSTFVASSLEVIKPIKPRKTRKPAIQSALSLSPVDHWRKHFHNLHRSNPGANPNALWTPRFPNPRNKTPDPKQPFDLNKFLGFGQFIASFTFKDASSQCQ